MGTYGYEIWSGLEEGSTVKGLSGDREGRGERKCRVRREGKGE